MEVRMRFDDRAWIVSDKVTDSWPLQIHDPVVFRKIGNFLLDFTAKDGVLFTILETGGFNIALQMEFERSRSAIIRFPLPGAVMFPEEKLRTEVAAMRYISDQTSIPVPLVIHSGTKKESPMELAPFIIDSIFSADDCRSKFVAGFLFRKLTRDPELRSQWIKHENGPFPIWCDDFRSGNVLLGDDLRIAGVVDWEFTYAAPVEFTHAPPWWLILVKPEYDSRDLTEWSLEFESRLPIFLKAMADGEDEAIQKGRLSESQRLSNRMQQSWDSGDFWIVYAATHSFAVDAIYWAMIDKRFFGPTSTKDICAKWRERLHLLDAAELTLMEEYVELKLSQMETRALAWDPDQYTLDHIQRMDET